MTTKHTQKGKRGFQKIPENLQKTSVYNYKMTRAEYDAINNFCKANEITKAELFRNALNTFYLANDIKIMEVETNDPNQLRID